MSIVQKPAFGILDLRGVLARQANQIGEPVSVRVHVSVADGRSSWPDIAHPAAAVVGSVFDLSSFSWRVRRGEFLRMLNLLGQNEAGQTALVTLARGYVSAIAVTVFGNHGALRLDESEFAFDQREVAQSELPESLRTLLAG